MKTVIITRVCEIAGKKHFPDAVLPLADHDAEFLIANGAAREEKPAALEPNSTFPAGKRKD